MIGATDQKSFYEQVEYYCPGKCNLEKEVSDSELAFVQPDCQLQ